MSVKHFITIVVALTIVGCKVAKLSETDKAMIPVTNEDLKNLQNDILVYKFNHSGIWPFDAIELQSFNDKVNPSNNGYINFSKIDFTRAEDTLVVNYDYLYPKQLKNKMRTVVGEMRLFTPTDSTAAVSHEILSVKQR
ncbi:MAG: hypothetical protein JXQ96_01190 [Cyclobacteriaceae bacterium]